MFACAQPSGSNILQQTCVKQQKTVMPNVGSQQHDSRHLGMFSTISTVSVNSVAALLGFCSHFALNWHASNMHVIMSW